MNGKALTRHLFYCLSLVLLGCASLHVDVAPTVDWGTITIVALQGPQPDPWQLTPAVKTELEAIGLQTSSSATDSDLLVRYSTQEGPDLNADGEVTTRLKSLHLQFIDPATESLVTAVDYFFPANGTVEPVAGVKEAFAGLRQHIRSNSALTPAAHAEQAPRPAVESGLSATPDPPATHGGESPERHAERRQEAARGS